MSVNVKAIFPSKAKKKNKSSEKLNSGSGLQSPTKSSGILSFWPTTPESTRKNYNASSTYSQLDEVKTPSLKSSPPQTPSTRENAQCVLDNEKIDSTLGDLKDGRSHFISFGSRTGNVAVSHRESVSESTGVQHIRSSSVNSETSCYADSSEAPMIDQEDINTLTIHVRSFSEAVNSLRNTFIDAEDEPDIGPEQQKVKAHEHLGEVLSILKGVLNRYPPLHSTDILASAGTLIKKVKNHNYDDAGQAPDEFYESIDQLALAFSSSVSDFLMGEQDLPLEPSENQAKYLDEFDEDDLNGLTEEEEKEYDDDFEDDQEQSEERREHVDTSAEQAAELDKAVIRLERGVDIAMERTKVWSKYAKDIATYVERRSHLELEYSNKLARLAQTTRSAISEENYLPLQSIYITALDQDSEFASSCAKTCEALMGSRFMEPLNFRRTRHDLRRKELKNVWTKECKRLKESVDNLEKARRVYIQRKQELEKLNVRGDAKEDLGGTLPFSSAKKKKEGNIQGKAEEAEESYKNCVTEANERQERLQNLKRNILIELRQMVYQCDMTMKAVTCNYFQHMNAMTAPAPVQFQTLAESSRLYEPGTQFADFIRTQKAHPARVPFYSFEPFNQGDKLHPSPARHNSCIDPRHHDSEPKSTSPFTTRRNKSLQLHHQINSKAWKENSAHSDDSTGSRSLPPSPAVSPVVSRKKVRRRKSPPDNSTEDESGKESDGKEIRRMRKPTPQHFRNLKLSAAANTHKLRKLRSPSRCRECDNYVYFNGAECVHCGISCHRKCLGHLSITCSGHQRIPRKMTTFGVDFQSHLKATDKLHENVPPIVTACINEVDKRGLTVKGIYRVPGVKSKVEKLCQAFESTTAGVDLSDIPPHCIAAVLKLYLRQLPEPLLTFELYPKFFDVAKESMETIKNVAAYRTASQNGEIVEEYQRVVQKLREVVVQLPRPNFVTAAKVISHLHKVAENNEHNHMPASNLGIVFGPTLLRPSKTTTDLAALVDTDYQTRAVELLISNPEVFDSPDQNDPAAQDTPIQEFSPSSEVPNKDENHESFDLHSVRPRIGIKGSSTPPLHHSMPSLPSAPFYSHDHDDSSSSLDFSSMNSSTLASTSFSHDSSGFNSSNSTPSASSPALLLDGEVAHTQHLPNALESFSDGQDSSTTSVSDLKSPDSSMKSPKSSSSTLSTSTAFTVRSRKKPNSFPIVHNKATPNPALQIPTTGSLTKRISLGFGSEFFDLLDKSNNRNEEVEWDRYDLPEFLLSRSADYKKPEHESDDEEVDVGLPEETYSGHSSRTPGVELTSQAENLKSNSRTKIHDDSGHNNSLPNHGSVTYSRCPSDNSNAPSFSTMDNLDSMLPDYSEQKAESLSSPRSPTSPKSNHQFDLSQTPEEIARRQKFLDDAELYSKSYAERPRAAVQASRLGLVKRNSDLPARMSQSSSFNGDGFPLLPAKLKSSSSESDVRLASIDQVCENVKDSNFEVTSNSEVFQFLEKMPEVHDFLGTSARHPEGTSGEESERETPFSQENIPKEGKRKVTVVRNEQPDITLNKEENDERIVVQKRIEMESMVDLEETIIDPDISLKKEGPENLNSVMSGEDLISSPPASPGKGKLAVEPLTSPFKLHQEFNFSSAEPIVKLVNHRIDFNGDLGEKCPLATPESSYTDFEQVEKLMPSQENKNSPNKTLFIPIDSAVLDRKPSDDETSDTIAAQNVLSFQSSANIVVKQQEKPREKPEQPRTSSEQSRNHSKNRNDLDSGSKFEKRKMVRTSSTGNISVKDRRKQFEERTNSSDSSPKTAANVHISLASRKQILEQAKDRSQLYKRSSELTSRRLKGELDRENFNSRHVKGNPEVDGACQSNGLLVRPKATSLVDLSALDSVSSDESSVQHSKKANERPRSLFLERLKLDRMEPLKDIQKASKQYVETLEYDKDRLSKKEIDISFESCPPVRNSHHIGKMRFLEDDKTDREPQFV